MIQKTEQEVMQNWKKDRETPLVSICTITYNHENYIEEALDSFLMQETDFPFEIVIDDDCSPDGTAEIITKYKEKFPNIIKANLRKKNIGAMDNSISNMKRAEGKYIALCEGDDYWTDPKKLQIQLDLMMENQECYLSFHPAYESINHSLTNKIWGYQGAEKKIFTVSEIILGGGKFCPTASLVFKKEVIANLPTLFSEDYFVQILGSLNGGALYINRKMSTYRFEHSESITSKMREKENKSVDSLIEHKKDFAARYIKSLNKLGDFIDKKHRASIDRKISERLFTLAILYLKNNRHEEFKKTISQSHHTYKSVFLSHRILYYFRFMPTILKSAMDLRKSLRS